MATYVIGDIQGCVESLTALLRRCQVTRQDHLWFVGDLVNRGPYSLEVLELLIELGGQVRAVLGNHDLHLLACHAGATPSKGDTLDTILSSPRREELIAWLRARPLLYEEGGHAMLHAGLNPSWSWPEVQRRAQRAHLHLMSDEGLQTLARHHPSRRALSEQGATPEWIEDLAWLTRVRFIQAGRVYEALKGGPEEAGAEQRPWYELYERSLSAEVRPSRLYVGHWAALGLKVTPRLVSLDTGCIWGRYLTAMRLEDGALFMQSTLEPALTPKHQRARS
jgi:bis(5'-nucleosyl)-tetraphosphatase (symmetrical)